MRNNPVVAIDGPSGVGKSTVAKGVAKAMGFQFVDTGALYRTVAKVGKDRGIDWDDGPKLAEEAELHTFEFDQDGELSLDGSLVGESIRTNEMARGASTVAKLEEVRDALLKIQRKIGEDGAVVLEGRDIGTVVFPDAETKFFLSASPHERARRRFLQLKESGQDVTLEEVEAAQLERDKQDSQRALSPLRKAEDAIELNCESVAAQQVIEAIVREVRARFP